MKTRKIAIMLLSGACILSMSAGLAACGDDELPNVEAGESTTLVTDKAPDELTPENALFAFLQKQSELQSYRITTEGTAVADLMGYTQEIHNITFKNGEDFLNQAKSESFLVDMEHQAFSKNGKVVWRDSFDGEMNVAEKESYKKVYGFTADEITLGGYIINAKTLRYATLEKTEGDVLTYYFRLAGDQSLDNGTANESATAAVRLQAKAYGSLDNLPSYSDVDMRLTVKKDWTPVSYTSTCSYDCKKVFDMNIVQTLTCTYSNVNETVVIPDAAKFNEKLGSTPSAVSPEKEETDPLMQLAGAFGNAMNASGALDLPVSVSIDLFGKPITLSGELALGVKRDALKQGSLSDAVTLRFDLDISAIPLVSSIANTVTVRYPGDGLLLIMLNRRAEGKDNYLFTQTVDLKDAVSLPGLSFAPEQIQGLLTQFIDLTVTDAGYTLSLKEAPVALLDEVYGALIDTVEAALGDTGLIRSLLGTTFTEISLGLTGKNKIESATFLMRGTPAENTTTGEKIDVSIDTKLIGGAFTKPFTGELDIHLDPAALWAGNYFALAKAHLRLDLTPAAPLLQMFGALGGMIPDIPSWLSADLNSLNVYYLGDGVLTLALNNAAGDPVFTTDVDLTQLIPPVGGGTIAMQGLPQIIFEIKENGFEISLGEALVQKLDAAYQSLVQKAVDYVTEAAGGDMLGAFAGQMIQGWIGAEITGAGIFVGRNDDGKVTFSLTVNGKPTNDRQGDYSERALLTLTLTHNEALSEDEKNALLATGETVKNLRTMNEKAAGYDARLQTLLDEMDLTEAGYDAYIKSIEAFETEINNEAAGVRSLMATKSYLATKPYNGGEYTLLMLTAVLYHDRVEQFKAKVSAIKADAAETEWDELNALYEKDAAISGITVPAIKGNNVLETGVGADALESYRTKRNAHEDAIVQSLIKQIAASEETYQNATSRDQLTEALTEIVTTFKPVYDKLPADKQANVIGYSKYVKDIYIRNINGVMAEYKEVQTELEKLDEDEDVTIDELLAAMKKLSSAYAWGYGYDYWVTNTIKKVQPWGTTWITSLKPKDLNEDEQAKISDLNTLNRSFMKGEIATSLSKYTDLIITEVGELYEKIKTCRIVGDDGGKDEWKFETLGEEADELLETIHGLRFLICKVLPSSINDEFGKESPELNQFARIDITKYEEALVEYVNSTSGD